MSCVDASALKAKASRGCTTRQPAVQCGRSTMEPLSTAGQGRKLAHCPQTQSAQHVDLCQCLGYECEQMPLPCVCPADQAGCDGHQRHQLPGGH